MSRRDSRHAFAAMARGKARRYQMTQKAPKEQIPALVAELVNRESNLKTLGMVQKYLATVHVAGADAVGELSRCFAWLSGISQGEAARAQELKDLLPDQDAEIKLGPEEPAVSVSGIELQKGEPVLGPA